MKKNKNILIIVLSLITGVLIFFYLNSSSVEDSSGDVKGEGVQFINEEFAINYGDSSDILNIYIDKNIKNKCFRFSTGFVLSKDNIVEKSFKIPSTIFSCIEDNFEFKHIQETKRGDVLVDESGNMHILKSNINLELNGLKIYGQ